MPNKTEEYLALACKTADSFSRQWEHWAEFLITAARLYKYSYPDQLMIYAQRPDATACAEYDVWNNKMNRYVRRGSKGIALLDESGGYPRLHYVFDVSDTAPRRNALYPDLWQINESLKEPVRSMLAENYGVHSESFGQQLADVAGKLVQSYWDNNSSDILGIVDGSYLMSYDDAGRELQFKSAAAMGVTYMLLERCGLDPAGWFDEKDFQAVYDFTTPSAVYALGTAVSDCSREVLRQIERTVKTTIRRRNIERSQEEYEQQSELHEDRGLFSAEPDLESAPEAAEPVRKDAPELSDGAVPGGVQHNAAERDPVPAPMGGGTDGRKQDATADERTVGEKPGSGQGEKTDGVGAAHEQPESAGRGNDPDQADLQLNFLEAAIPTEAQQIESIDQAESEKSSSAFVLSQADIEKALRRGSNFENSKLRIWEIYQTQPDRKLRAKALAKEYAPHGPGGCSHTYLDGSSGWLDHDSKGLTFEHYPDHQKIFLRWNQVEKYIDLMMQADRYLTDKEKSAIELYFELNADSAAEYNALKEQYPDALVGFEQNGQFEFYGEDARKICELTGGKLLERETALGTVLVTGFPREQWVYRAKQLWECGENIYLAGLNEDGTHHQTKYLRREEYLPVGSIQQIPTVHLGPAAHQMEKRGVETFLGNLNRDIRAANSLMQSIRSAIRGLQRWIADLNEKKQLLLDALEKAKEPTLSDLLVDYFNLRNEQRSDWSGKAKLKCTVRDFEEIRQAVDYLKAHSLNTIEDLDTAISNLNQTAAPLRRQLKQNENRVRAIAQIKDAAAVHAKLKPVHDTFIKKNFKLTKDAYAAQHKEELDTFNKAVRTLMKLNGSTTVNFSALDAEFSALQSGSAELRSQLETLQPDLTALKNVHKYIDLVLNKQQLSAPGGKTPEKESVLKKLHEAKATPKKPEQRKNSPEL